MSLIFGDCTGCLPVWVKSLSEHRVVILSPQRTVTTKLKLVDKVRELRAINRVPTPLAPPAPAHTGVMTAWHHTNILTGAPWSPYVLPMPPLPLLPRPPHDQADLRTLASPQSSILVRHALYSQGRHETAQNLATLILSGECVCVHLNVQTSVISIHFSQVPWWGKLSFCCSHTHARNGTHTQHRNLPGSHRLDQSRFI